MTLPSLCRRLPGGAPAVAITIAYLCRRLRYEATTGRLYWRHYGPLGDRYNNRWAGREAFTSVSSNGYRHGSVDGVHMLAHRLIWAMWHGKWPEDEIDHEDHDKTHNWISNLRERDHAGNARNMARSRANTSGVTGVVWNAAKGRWQAQIRKTFLGYFDSLDDAAAARKAADVALGFDPKHGVPQGPTRWPCSARPPSRTTGAGAAAMVICTPLLRWRRGIYSTRLEWFGIISSPRTCASAGSPSTASTPASTPTGISPRPSSSAGTNWASATTSPRRGSANSTRWLGTSSPSSTPPPPHWRTTVNLNDTFARNFEAASEASPMTHQEIADISGFSPNYLRKLRRGHCPKICLNTVEVLAQTLDLPAAALLGEG